MRAANSPAGPLSIFFLAVLTPSLAFATDRHVPATYATIQAAINASRGGDTVIVAPGTYHERINFNGKNITVISETPDDPIQTTIDADLLGSAVTMVGTPITAKLVGFMIIEGDETSGGCVYVEGAATLDRCLFSAGHATSGGGASVVGDCAVTNCTFNQCTGTNGAGLSVQLGNATISDCIFEGCNATNGGGLFAVGMTSLTVLDCTFHLNSATTGGGASFQSSVATIANCNFLDNTAVVGSSLDFIQGDSVVRRCRMESQGNYDLDIGGEVTIQNSVIDVDGAAARILATTLGPADVRLRNCTVVAGEPAFVADATYAAAHLDCANSIVRSPSPCIELLHGGTASVAYTNLSGGYAGAGNIDADPQFMGEESGNFQLQRTSPCVDAGNSSLLPPGIVADFAGEPRRVNEPSVTDTGVGAGSPVIDMGANELQATIRYVDADATGANNGATWADAYVDLQDALDESNLGGIGYVFVAEGNYRPDRGSNARSQSFLIDSPAWIVGGFAGGEDDIDERRPIDHLTVLSGAIGGAGSNDNSFHVVRVGPDCEALVIGFAIQRGNANGASGPENDRGGGVYVAGGAVAFVECWIRQNEADFAGAGVYQSEGSHFYIDSRFNQNVSQNEGSAITVVNGFAYLINDLVHGNDAANLGAVTVHEAALAVLSNCTIADNYSISSTTGGVYGDGGSAIWCWSSLLRGNDGTGVPNEQQNFLSTGLVDVRSTSIQGWSGAYGGIANNGLNPDFASPFGPDGVRGNADDDYHLLVTSPAIDSGGDLLQAVASEGGDLEGNDRWVDIYGKANSGTGTINYIDRGCYEFSSCLGDLNYDGTVDAADLAILLGGWMGSGPVDLDESGVVDAADLAILLGAFGPC